MVAIVIVTYNSEAVVGGCLESLHAGLDGVGQCEVVVVDNASSDGTCGVVAGLAPECRLVQMGRNTGYAAAVNAGVAAASDTGPVLVLNPDVRLDPACLRNLLGALDVPGVGIAVPRIEDGDGNIRFSLRREPSLMRALGEAVLGGRRAGRFERLGELVTEPSRYDRPGNADWATGSTMLISRQCLDEVGPWDDSFFLYSEETDFALRARDVGWSLRYVPEAKCIHFEGRSGTSPLLWAILISNRVRLYRKRHGWIRAAPYWAAVLLNETLRAGQPTHRAALTALLVSGRRHKIIEELQGERAPAYVCFAGVDWWYSNRAHADFQIMTRVAATRRVLLVNSIGMRMPLPGRSTEPWRRVMRKAGSIARFIRRPVKSLPEFFVLSPAVLPLYGSRAGRAVNAALVRRQVQLVSCLLGIRAPVYVVTLPTAWDVIEPLPRRALLVNKADKYSSWSEVDQTYIYGLEQALLEHADTVLYVSHTMMEADRSVVGARGVFLDHGVDFLHFTPRPPDQVPADLVQIPRPRLGFFGSLDDYKVDFDLLERIALDIPEAHIVLIGDATCSMARLTALPNVHWLGSRPYDEIPMYGSGFDIGLMPYLDNDWIRNSNPIKLKEYLALGLPSVCTPLPEAHYYEEWVLIAADADDFVDKIRSVLRNNGPSTPAARRVAVAHSSWERCAELLVQAAESTRPGSSAR